MTEAEWLTCTEPKLMLDYLTTQGKASDRRLRLFACACVRQSWSMLDKQSRNAVSTAERFAEGVASKEETFRLASSCMTIARCLMPTWDSSEEANMVIEMAEIHNRAALPGYADALRDIFGNPFRPVRTWTTIWATSKNPPAGKKEEYIPSEISTVPWITPTVMSVAQVIYQDRTYSDMGVLADALEEAGCDDEQILNHCRHRELCQNKAHQIAGGNYWCPDCGGTEEGREGWMDLRGGHVHGCWAISLLLGLG